MKIGFLVWNKFQVAHFAELIRQFDEPDIIFVDRDPKSLHNFDPGWLMPLGGFTRFLPETKLDSLDGQFDFVLSQFNPPLQQKWSSTKLVMYQYSLTKPKTLYNLRWLGADLGLVYGDHSSEVLSPIVHAAKVGNSRFDPFFEERLCPVVSKKLRAMLDPGKPNLLYSPTWGDLSSAPFGKHWLSSLTQDFNVIVNYHHLAGRRDSQGSGFSGQEDLIFPANEISSLDLGPHLMEIADVVVSDMSGAIFDALYCRKPVVLLNSAANLLSHKKAHPMGIEISRRAEIGREVTTEKELRHAVAEALESAPYRNRNEELVAELFIQRGSCANLAKEALLSFRDQKPQFGPPLTEFAFSKVREKIQPHAFTLAKKRSERISPAPGGTAAYRAMLVRVIRTILRGRWPRRNRGLLKPTKTKIPTRRLLRSLIRKGMFFEAGIILEESAKEGLFETSDMFKMWSHYQNPLRFSRTKMRAIAKELLETTIKSHEAPDASIIQQALGSPPPETNRLDRSQSENLELERLPAELGRYQEIAARNEICDPDFWNVITPTGAEVNISKSGEKVFEMALYQSLLVEKVKDHETIREPMKQVTWMLINELLSHGYSVLPRIQTSFLGTAFSGKYPCASWHTKHVGSESHLHLKVGALPGFISIDLEGFAGWASIATAPIQELIRNVSPQEAEMNFQELRASIVDKGISKYRQKEDPPPDVGSYIFLPMQVVDDPVTELAYIKSLALLDFMVDWAKGRQVSLVVKRHPRCKDSHVKNVIEKYKKKSEIIVSSASVHSLVSGSDAVVTVNSGVAAEALLHLKPVITTGAADYSAGTWVAHNEEELAAALERLPRLPLTNLDLKKFLWFYSKRYQVSPHRPNDVRLLLNRVITRLERD